MKKTRGGCGDMNRDKEAFVAAFSEIFIREWTEVLSDAGITFVGGRGSTTRMLAETIARSLHEWEEHLAEIVAKS